MLCWHSIALHRFYFSLFCSLVIHYFVFLIITPSYIDCSVIEDIGLKALEHFSILMRVLLTLLKDENAMVVKQCIITGTSIFCCVLEELSLQVCVLCICIGLYAKKEIYELVNLFSLSSFAL